MSNDVVFENDDTFATDLAYGVNDEHDHVSPESIDSDTGLLP